MAMEPEKFPGVVTERKQLKLKSPKVFQLIFYFCIWYLFKLFSKNYPQNLKNLKVLGALIGGFYHEQERSR